ncbi:hypothetical protein [Paenibacillus sp. IITD108]|uniref:hypothetical protein n=1 Tax=Paenibacillus sp. IITD108 TaxID=3116649 RepID=UPI002F4119D3
MAAKIYKFPEKIPKTPRSIKDLFSAEEYQHYVTYIEQAEIWRREKKSETLYEGYPFKAPSEVPIRGDMVWYVNESDNFGVWVINHSPQPIARHKEILFGWSPFVRYTVAPPMEPVRIDSTELRNRIVWYVNKDGYGQYAVIKSSGELWIPIAEPENWQDHNKIYGYL